MFKKIFIGHNPLTTLAGYALAGLYAAQAALQAGTTKWHQIALPVAIAIFGRVAGDTNNTLNRP